MNAPYVPLYLEVIAASQHVPVMEPYRAVTKAGARESGGGPHPIAGAVDLYRSTTGSTQSYWPIDI